MGPRVIPPRSNREEKREYDRDFYKDGNLVERFINRAKHFRRIATRYEGNARDYMAFRQLGSIMVLLA